MRRYIGISLVILVLIIVGCSTSEKQELSSKASSETSLSDSASATAKAKAGALEVKITKQEYGSSWPFTVKEGVLICKHSGITIGTTEMKEVLFMANGVTYAVNGYAKGSKKYPDVRKVWADDPSMPGLKKNIGPIIERALAFPEEPPAAMRPSMQRKNVGAPPPELDSKVQKYNKLLQQAQRFLAKELVAEQEHMRAVDKWEAVHGEINYDKPYPRQLAKLASVRESYQAKQAQSMEKAADMLQVIKASPAFPKYYREGELAVGDEVPGLLIGTHAEHLRFVRRL